MTDNPYAENARRPISVIAMLRRRAWLLIPCVVLATGAAYFVAHREQKRYSATASLLFQTSQFSQELFGYAAVTTSEDPTTEQATNVALVSEPVIAVDAARTLGHAVTSARVASEVSVAAAGASDLVNVTATDPSPAFAAKLANAYAQDVITYEEQSQRAQVDQAASQLRGQIRLLPAGSNQLPALNTRLSQLEALASLQTGNVQLAGQALAPGAPSLPHVSKITVIGFLCGLLVGLAAVLVAERVDATLRDPSEALELIGLPLLGVIPATRGIERRNGEPVLSDAFRLLRTQLQYFNVDRDIRSILVTSAGPGDGKSTVAWHLACAVASLSPGSSVLLLDCDMRRPAIAALSDTPQAPGLAGLLTDNALPLERVIRTVTVGDGAPGPEPATLSVLTAGATPPNPAQLIESRKFKSVLDRLSVRFDLLIIDAPPILLVPDAIPLVGQVSGVLVVARPHHTQRATASALRQQLRQLGAPSLGLVVNDVSSANGYASYSVRTETRPAEPPFAPLTPRESNPRVTPTPWQ